MKTYIKLLRVTLLIAGLLLMATSPIFVAYYFYTIAPNGSGDSPVLRSCEVKRVHQLKLEEVMVSAPDGSVISKVVKPLGEVIIKLPREIAKVELADDEALVSIDSEVCGSEVKSVTWRVWYKRGDTWHITLGEEPPSNITLHNVNYVILKRAEGFSTRIVIEVLLRDGTKRVEELGINGYIPRY